MDGDPPAFDPEVPSIARTYDYLLGGKDNFPADRAVGDIFKNRFPGAVQIALDNRACLIRAVRYMTEDLGIRQFIDFGSGLPTADNVHQVAQRTAPDTAVVYVDNDPLVLAHGRALLAENPQTTVVAADIRRPAQVLAAAEVRALIDFSRPVGMILSAILHHVLATEDPPGLVQTVRDAMPAGSCLFVSHFRTLGDESSRELEAVMIEAFGRGVWRSTEEIQAYFGDLRLVEPGVVPCALWRPDEPPGELTPWQQLIIAGLGTSSR
ncbi:MAG TPA: SAM-dependent methyltransferase [Streptosporangiaceae bacterium]|nr:SAM-dependent methyltransferase [Streptosporangiaceae bacterium]